MRTHKELTYVPKTDNIILGFQLGEAETEHGRLVVTGSGKTVRFQIDGIDGYVDLDLSNYAAAAVEWLSTKDATP